MSGNPVKGEVAFTVGEAAYTLVYSIDALCVLEDKLDMSVSRIAETLGDDPRLSFLRTVFWGGLQTHHPSLSVKQAGELITDLKIDRAAELIGEAIVKAFPTSKDAAPSPPKRQARAAQIGTGLDS